MAITHSLMSGNELHDAFHYVQETEPVGIANKYWLDPVTGVVKRRNAANTVWILIGGSGGGGGGVGAGTILGFTSYYPVTNATYTNASGTSADVDATNLAVNFTVPTSGKVLIELEATADSTSTGFQWVLRSGASEVTNTKKNVAWIATLDLYRAAFYVSGLTSGASLTWKWGFALGRVYVGNDAARSPALMRVIQLS